MRLNKNEILFIKFATMLPEGIFDYENNDDERFKSVYDGLTKEDVDKVVISLKQKVVERLNKKASRKRLP